jgi:hypothetical protein
MRFSARFDLHADLKLAIVSLLRSNDIRDYPNAADFAVQALCGHWPRQRHRCKARSGEAAKKPGLKICGIVSDLVEYAAGLGRVVVLAQGLRV